MRQKNMFLSMIAVLMTCLVGAAVPAAASTYDLAQMAGAPEPGALSSDFVNVADLTAQPPGGDSQNDMMVFLHDDTLPTADTESISASAASSPQNLRSDGHIYNDPVALGA